MHTNSNAYPEHLQNPEVSFEKRDLGARGILLFFVVLFIAGVTIHLIIWGVYEAFVKVSSQNEPPALTLAPQESSPPPSLLQNTPSINMARFPEPRLQSSETGDMNRFLWQEQQLLDAKPWRGTTGAVHIPIDRAMQLVAQRGLPALSSSQQQPTMGQTEPGNAQSNEIQNTEGKK